MDRVLLAFGAAVGLVILALGVWLAWNEQGAKRYGAIAVAVLGFFGSAASVWSGIRSINDSVASAKEIARLQAATAPRMIAEDAAANLEAALKAIPGEHKVMQIMTLSGDVEGTSYGRKIEAIFKRAGWDTHLGSNLSVDGGAHGCVFGIHPLADVPAYVNEVGNALHTSGISSKTVSMTWAMPFAIYVFSKDE